MSAMRVGVGKSLLVLSLVLLLRPTTLSGQVPARVVEAVDNSKRITLTGNVHPLARAEFDRGAVPGSLPMKRILLLLKRSDAQEAALQSFLEQQQDKTSPNYHQWMTPAEFGAQYGPADSDIQAVTQWLAGQGFTIEKVYSGKTIIEFSGTAAQVQSAFGAAIRNYEVSGKLYSANANDPQIPLALASVVSGIVSLNNFPRQSHARLVGTAQKVAGSRRFEPLFTYPNPFGGSGDFYAVGPGDFATIYNSKGLIASGNDGKGQAIAIVGETNINVTDVQAFRQLFGLPPSFSSANVILNGPDPGITSAGEETEADLDVQWSGAVAPGATVDLVVSASTSTSAGIDLSALYIIDNDLAAVMSESYGGCESGLGTAGNAFYNSLWEQAAAQGITAIVSAGDNGSAGCDDFGIATEAVGGLAVNGIASTPYNVAVGGTDFDQINQWSTFWSSTNVTTGTDVIGTSALGYIPEIPWNNSCAQIGLTGCGSSAPQALLNIVAGSGGASKYYSKPKWQMGVTGVPNDSHRDLPDASVFASAGFDGSAYIICQADAYPGIPCSITTPGGVNVQIVGGTSASAPAFAGVMALVNQKQSSTQNTAPRQGNANYVLYALAKKPGASCTSGPAEASTCIFNDVTHGNSYVSTKFGSSVGTNSVPCKGGTPNCSLPSSSPTGVLMEPNSQTTEGWPSTSGYDLATGLGSVNVSNLASNWGSVSTVATTTTLTLAPTTSSHGSNENINYTITVTPQSGTASGDVSLVATMTGSAGNTMQGLAQFTLGSNGSVSGTTQSLPGGTYTVTAHYAGDGTNAPSDSTPPVQVTVSPEASKTFANLATFDINGNPISFTATSATYGSGFAIFRVDVGDSASAVSSSTGISSNCSKGLTNCPTGTVTLSSTSSSLGTSSMLLNILGYAETQPLPPGTYSVSANYPGDSSYGSSTTSTSFTISKAPVTVAAAPAGTPVQLGNFTQIVATISTTSNGAAPTGTCQFLVDGNPLGNPVPIGQSIPYSPNLNPPYAWAAASSSNTFTSVGNHTLSAQYSGDSNYAAATSALTTVNVSQGIPYVTAYPSPNSINLGQQTTLLATVRGTAPSVTPTGTVTFLNGNTVLTGTITYTSSVGTLTASMPFTPATAETYQINGSYSGDTNYMAETTPVPSILTVTGPDFAMSPQPTSITVSSGSPASYTVAIAGTNGFTGTVNVSCALVAAATTCSGNPPSVTQGSSTTITVTTTKHQLIPHNPKVSSRRPGPLGVPLALFTAVFFLLLLLLHFPKIRHQPLAGTAFAALFFFLFLAVIGCGGGGGGGGTTPPPVFGTQAGTYQVTITATSGSITHTSTVTLIVN